MLAFIVPVRPKENAADWQDHCAHYHACIASLLRQNHNAFHIFTVCHDIPPGTVPSNQHTIVRAATPIPNRSTRQADCDAITKRMLGLAQVSAEKFSHFMFVDSDDRVSLRLAGFVAEHPKTDGWFFPEGYHWKVATQSLRRWKSFEQFCGTSIVYPSRITAAVPSGMTEAVGFFRKVLQHNQARKCLRHYGVNLQPLPFPGSVYVYTAKNNLSYQRAYFWLWGWKRYLLSRAQSRPNDPVNLSEFFLPKGLQWAASTPVNPVEVEV
jgi:hypothetical protein